MLEKKSQLNPNIFSRYCCFSFEILELSSLITSSPKSSSPQAFLRNLLRYNSLKSSSLLSFSSLWLSFNLCCGWVTFLLWLVYICSCGWVISSQSPKPSYKKCAFRGEKITIFQKIPKLVIMGCIHLSLFVIWYPYLDNIKNNFQI